MQLAAAIIISAGITGISLKLWERQRHRFVQGREITVKGEVLDMTCYIAQNLSGPQHAQCARECIRRGLPAGIKTEDGKVYLLTGKPGQSINAELADYAASICYDSKVRKASSQWFCAASSRRDSKVLMALSPKVLVTAFRSFHFDRNPHEDGRGR